MTINQMASNFNILALAYFYGAIVYVVFLFCCHLFEVFQALKAEHMAKFIVEVSKPSLALSLSNQMTLRQLRDYVRVNNLQAQVKSVTGLSVSYCSKTQLVQALG